MATTVARFSSRDNQVSEWVYEKEVPPNMTEGASRIVLMMGISLDGFVAVSNGTGLTPVMEGGELPPEDPELTKTKLDWIWEAGAHLMGRNTYEEMASYWPTSSHEYAAPMNEIPKIVFSKSLKRADWPSRGSPEVTSRRRSPN